MDSTIALQADIHSIYTSALVFGTALILLVLARVFIPTFWSRRKKKAVKAVPMQQPVPVKSTDPKKAYLKKLAALETAFAQNEITPRACYQTLSGLVRSYVEETKGIDVTTKTLPEIRMMKMPGLETLMEEYYEAEFGPEGAEDGRDPVAAIKRAKKAVKTWN